MRPNRFQTLFWWPNENLPRHCLLPLLAETKPLNILLAFRRWWKWRPVLLTPVISEVAVIMTMRELLTPKEGAVPGDSTALREWETQQWGSAAPAACGELREPCVAEGPETQAVDKKGGHLSYSWISVQHDGMRTATWPFQPRKHEAGIATTQPVY